MLNAVRSSDGAPHLSPEFSSASVARHKPHADFSATLAWAREQDQKESGIVSTQQGKEHLKAHIEVLTTMLQSASSNPLENNGVEGMRLLQALVEGIERVKQEDIFKNMARSLQENNFFQAANLVGKQGEFISHNFKIGHNSSDDVSYEVTQGSALEEITIDVFGRGGLKLASVNGPTEDGRHSLMPLFSHLEPGSYSFRVWGVNTEGEVVDVQHIVASEIDSIKVDGSMLLARVGTDFEPLTHLRGVSVASPHPQRTLLDAAVSTDDESHSEGVE